MTVASTINAELGANLKSVDTGSNTGVSPTLPYTPGTAISGDRFSDWVYVQAGSGFGAGQPVSDGFVVTFDATFTATLLLQGASSRGKVGQFVGVIRTGTVAQPVTIAQGNGFWVQVCGQANIAVKASTTAFTQLKSSATNGTLTSATAAGSNTQLNGIVVVSAVGASDGVVEGTLNYPTLNQDL